MLDRKVVAEHLDWLWHVVDFYNYAGFHGLASPALDELRRTYECSLVVLEVFKSFGLDVTFGIRTVLPVRSAHADARAGQS